MRKNRRYQARYPRQPWRRTQRCPHLRLHLAGMVLQQAVVLLVAEQLVSPQEAPQSQLLAVPRSLKVPDQQLQDLKNRRNCPLQAQSPLQKYRQHPWRP